LIEPTSKHLISSLMQAPSMNLLQIEIQGADK
jgi:hypothetical protein